MHAYLSIALLARFSPERPNLAGMLKTGIRRQMETSVPLDPFSKVLYDRSATWGNATVLVKSVIGSRSSVM